MPTMLWRICFYVGYNYSLSLTRNLFVIICCDHQREQQTLQFAANTGAQLPTSSIIILTEMFAFCLSVRHFHKRNWRKMMISHCTRSSAQVKNAQAFLSVRSAEQPLAAPERVPFFPYSLGKQRIGLGVYCSALISINKIKGGE